MTPEISSGGGGTDHEMIPMLFYTDELHRLPAALRSHGGAYILNAPLPPPPFKAAKSALFNLSQEEKYKLQNGKSTIRGYNSAFISGREWWDYTPETDVPNRRLPEDATFNSETVAYFDAAVVVLGECINALRKEYDAIPAAASDYGLSTIRYLRYSPDLVPLNRKANTTTTARMPPHTDHGSLTLMTATPPSGLYIYSPAGVPLPAPPINNTVLIIAADCIAHWTKAGILPTPHEVVVSSEKETQERISVAVFLRPAREVELGDGKTYGDWVDGKPNLGNRCWLVGRGPRRQ